MVVVEWEGDRGKPQAGYLDSHTDGQTNKQKDGFIKYKRQETGNGILQLLYTV